jgi:2-hydroxychromene-2-carboxylate isomerase
MPTLGVAAVKVVNTMRGAYFAEEHGKIAPYTRRAFESFWVENCDIGSDSVIAAIARDVGLDPAQMVEAIKRPEYKEKLRAATQELIDRGGFGSPTFFVDGNMFFGNDRLQLVEFELSR